MFFLLCVMLTFMKTPWVHDSGIMARKTGPAMMPAQMLDLSKEVNIKSK